MAGAGPEFHERRPSRTTVRSPADAPKTRVFRFAYVGPFPRPGGVPITALSANGDVLFVSLWTIGIARLQASDSQILDRTPNTVLPSLARVAPDGTILVTVESNYSATSKISVMDLR